MNPLPSRVISAPPICGHRLTDDCSCDHYGLPRSLHMPAGPRFDIRSPYGTPDCSDSLALISASWAGCAPRSPLPRRSRHYCLSPGASRDALQRQSALSSRVGPLLSRSGLACVNGLDGLQPSQLLFYFSGSLVDSSFAPELPRSLNSRCDLACSSLGMCRGDTGVRGIHRRIRVRCRLWSRTRGNRDGCR